MHPLLGRPARLLLVIASAALTGVPLAWLLRLLEPRPWSAALAFAVPMQVFYGFVVLSAWWVCRRHPMGGAGSWRAASAQCAASIQASAVWAGMGAIWAVFLSRWLYPDLPRAAIFRDIGVLFTVGIPIYLISAIAHYLLLAFEASHAAERRVLETEVTAREAELRALRAQLNPHFLFNSLNSVNALIGSDPEGARRMCEGLGDFLRRTLALGARETVSLGEELALVERYLGIEQVRFGERLRVERVVEPGATTCRVPPLLLQPLVENAVKHGLEARAEGGTITVVASDLDRECEITIEDDGAGADPDEVRRALAGMSQSVGLANVDERLRHTFGDEYGLVVETALGAGTRVVVRVPKYAERLLS